MWTRAAGQGGGTVGQGRFPWRPVPGRGCLLAGAQHRPRAGPGGREEASRSLVMRYRALIGCTVETDSKSLMEQGTGIWRAASVLVIDPAGAHPVHRSHRHGPQEPRAPVRVGAGSVHSSRVLSEASHGTRPRRRSGGDLPRLLRAASTAPGHPDAARRRRRTGHGTDGGDRAPCAAGAGPDPAHLRQQDVHTVRGAAFGSGFGSSYFKLCQMPHVP